jgi:DNA-binding NarL/FixJ family response regulator/class 3 adenylate cyclase
VAAAARGRQWPKGHRCGHRLDGVAVQALPTGIVTLWFADVEGSTALVRRLGGGYGPLIEQVRALLRAAVATGGGREVDCRGDELFAVFTSPDAAAGAAVDAQRSLGAAAWPSERPRIRIGIHTGEPSIADRTYFGVDVHVAHRVCSAGHGGQILLSGDAADALSRPGELGDLGRHELRGLPEPVRILQLAAPGLSLDFPALRLDRDPAVEAERAGVKVVLADDSVLLREGIARLLEDGGFDVVGQAGNAEELLLRVRSYSPDVAIVDIRMPPTHTDEGLRAAQEIREKHPGTGVLVLSQFVETGYALDLLADSAEGVGYLLKDRVSDIDEFRSAVRRVAEGGSALDPTVVSQLVGRRRRDDPLAALTPREREVLELMAEGRSNAAIAERLVVTERAVEKHVTSIFGKLRLAPAAEDHRRVLAVLAFLRG